MKHCLFLLLLFDSLLASDHCVNALANEESPYLRQHAHNPVKWYPWGNISLQKAKREQKLIFLSIGYSTCHWCHVMERESFEDDEVANLLNRDFVSIKVDKEEYPQIDKKYQNLYRKIYGKRGGWPLSVFLSPDGGLLELRTYIPKEKGYGSEGFMQLLPTLAKYRNNPAAMQKQVAYLSVQAKGKSLSSKYLSKNSEEKIVSAYLSELSAQFDRRHGGFAAHPKFPEASKIEALLTLSCLYENKQALQMASKTLDSMARGGIYDQVGGAFFRYTTDEAWEIPHFEKMLYTNAEMISAYANAYMVTDNPLYKKVLRESIEAIYRDFGYHDLFFSASDADSDGEEGGYFIYNYQEIRQDLHKKGWKQKSIEANLAYFGIEEDGNVDGELSQPHITESPKPPKSDLFKRYLIDLRRKRESPFVDRKINTAWNAMMAKALLDASKVNGRYLNMAERSLSALWSLMRRDGKLYHQALAGSRPRREAVLEDYAFLTDAMIEAYERTFDERYLRRAYMLAEEALDKFYKQGKWYLSDDHIGVEADFDDRHYTSALSVILDGFLKLAALKEDDKLYKVALKSIVLQRDMVSSSRLLQLWLRMKKGDIVIHASREKCLAARKKTDRIQYPFILLKAEKIDGYLACGMGQCFAKRENLDSLIEMIEN